MNPVLAPIYFSRAKAIEPIFAENGVINDRADFRNSSPQLFWQYFSFGFGPIGFVSAFQNTEPLALLNGAYLNWQHGSCLETALAFGVPCIILTLMGATHLLRRSLVPGTDGTRPAVAKNGEQTNRHFRYREPVAEYLLYTPAMVDFAALVLVWLPHARQAPEVG